jgi:phosphopantothenoylcysteine decarboxylase/phosphopantothenate--cysteine ligase
MHTEMWEHAATRANVATLRSRGVHVVDPAVGRLTGADSGAGRLPEPEDIYAACLEVLGRAAGDGPLVGRRVVVSAGGTREPLDPVRFLGNRSSGKQGLAIAASAAARGADVTLVAANVDLPVPDGIRVVHVGTTLELRDAVAAAARGADVVVMAAAPADFRPATVSDSKIKKDPTAAPGEGGLTVELVENPDIVRGLVADRDALGAQRPLVVSFAAETGDADGSVMDHARAKFARKGSDVQVVNEVGTDLTFGKDDTTVHVLRRGTDEVVTVGPASKATVADALWDTLTPLVD